MHKDTHDTFLPIAINITNKHIVIVGGGKVGLHKATILNRFTTNATVVSPTFHEGFDKLPFTLVRKCYERDDLKDAFLVYVCTEDETLNRQVKADAEALHILASVCDNPPLCDFISPAILRRGDLSIAVSSNARDVRRSIRVRNRLMQIADEGEGVLY